MGIENTGPWKHSEEKMKIFLNDTEQVEKTVDSLGKNKKKENVVQTTSNELSRINAEVLTNGEKETHDITDIQNVKEFLSNLSDQTKETLGELRYNGWSEENMG